MRQIAAGLGEGAKIRKRVHGGDAREFLAEVVGVAAAVVDLNNLTHSFCSPYGGVSSRTTDNSGSS